MTKRIPPQSLSWRVNVEPCPAVSYNGEPFIADTEIWDYTAYAGAGPWQEIEHTAYGSGVTDLATLGRWDSVEDLEADTDANPPEWLVAAIRAIESQTGTPGSAS